MSKLNKRLAKLTPEQLALLQKKLAEKKRTSDFITKRKNPNEYPLSFSQERLWFLHQLDPQSSFYNMPMALNLKGEINPSFLEKAVAELCRRHEILRSYYKTNEKGEPVQLITDYDQPPLFFVEVTADSLNEAERQLRTLMKNEVAAPFDLSAPPLARFTLYRLSSTDHVLLFNIHHIIADGWSVNILVKELVALYRAFVNNEDNPLPPLEIQYADFAQWQNERINSPQIEKQLNHWLSYLKGMPQTLEFVTDFPRPPVQSHRGKQVLFDIQRSDYQTIFDLAKKYRISPYSLLLAFSQVFLYKISGQKDFGVGIPLANRHRKEIEEIIGFFVNTGVIRAKIDPWQSFSEYAKKIHDDLLSASENQDVPFEKVVERLKPDHDLSRSPLFQVMFDLQKMPFKSLKINGIEITPLDIEINVSKFDLLLLFSDYEDRIRVILEYNTDIFADETIRQYVRYFQILLRQAFRFPEKTLKDLTLFSEEEKKRWIAETRKTHVPYPRESSVVALFEEQVQKRPDAPALSFNGQTVTYAQLNAMANRIAHYLLKNFPTESPLIGLFMNKSPQMIAAILAVLKCGKGYLPLDPKFPRQRIAFILDDTKTDLILTESSMKQELQETPAVFLVLDELQSEIDWESDANPAIPVSPEDLVYVMFTSGSTGVPKGVSVSHRSVIRLVKNTNYANYSPDEVTGFISSVVFDASTQELWGALLNGGRMAIFPGQTPSLQEIADFFTREKVSIQFITAGLFHLLVDEHLPALLNIKQLMAGGDVLSVSHVKRLLENLPKDNVFINGYGPTENTTFTLCHRMKDASDIRSSVPLGTPINNTKVYILDEHLNPVPPGVPGELFIAGDGLARDYFNRPGLTAERFLPNPFSGIDGDRMYRSGDLVRQRIDGLIEFIGRVDTQVKIRGFRIELGEIEAVLKQHPKVNDAVVHTFEEKPGDKLLVAYLIPADKTEINRDELKEYLKERIPSYMVPSAFVLMDGFPLNISGKVDRRALPRPQLDQLPSTADYVPPSNPLEQYLCDTWKDVLKIDRVGIRDNFFDLGGNSLKAAVFINRLQKDFNQGVPIAAVFKAPTVEQMAAYVLEYFRDVVVQHFNIKKTGAKFEIEIDEKEREKRIEQKEVEQFRSIIRPLPSFNDRPGGKNPQAIFVLSPPRSGSTLFRIMLAGHPKLFSPPELDLLSFNTLHERRQAFSTPNLQIWLEATIRAIMELRNCDFEHAKHIMDDLVEKNLSVKEFYGLLQEWAGDRILVDKTPTYPLDPNILRRAEEDFDQPVYIHLVRHPYAMIYSFIEAELDQNFFRYEHSFSRRKLAELIWIVSHQNILRHFENIPSERIYRLRFEDLLVQPEDELRKLCEFLNLDFHEEMLKPYHGNKMTDGARPHGQMVGDFKFYLHRDIDKSVAYKWKKHHKVDFLSDIAWNLAERFRYPIEKNLAQKIKTNGLHISPQPRPDKIPLSFSQQRIFFLDQFQPNSSQYNIPAASKLIGHLNIDILERSINEVIKRHESLRTIFKTDDGVPVQVILPELTIKIDQFDLRNLDSDFKEKEVQRLSNIEASRPFNLSTGPLIRASLIRYQDNEWVFIVVVHHIVSDGWSMNLFLNELSALYNALINNQTPQLPELPIQYADFALWQRKQLTDERLEELLNYWKRQLEGLSEFIELPTDFPRPPVATYEGRRITFRLSEELVNKIKNFTSQRHTTLFLTLLSAFQALLYRYSLQDDFAVGTPVANRTLSEIEPLIGFFVNTLVLRADLSGCPNLDDLIQRNQKTLLEALQHQEIPFEKLVDSLSPERSMSHSPLFQVMFSFHTSELTANQLQHIQLKPFRLETPTAKFDLVMEVMERMDGIVCIFEYKTSLFKESTIHRLVDHFIQLTSRLLDEPELPVDKLTFIPKDERQKLLQKWNREIIPFPASKTIGQAFEEQVEKTPDQIAVQVYDRTITFSELNRRANQLARFLRGKGAEPESIVGLMLERSVDLITGIFGIFKAGAAYLPLDPGYPQERLSFMLEDSQTKIVITQKKFIDRLPQNVVPVLIDDQWDEIEKQSTANLQQPLSSQNLAYIIYTSGSTGIPKGVMVQHRSVMNLIENLEHRIYSRFGSKKFRISMNAPISFDASVQKFIMLTRGHTLIIIPEEVRTDAQAMIRYIKDTKIDAFDSVPSMLRILIENGLLDDPVYKPPILLPGGEAIDKDTWRRLAAEKTIETFNMYGPTECTVDASICQIKDSPEMPSIGTPLANTRFYILDKNLEPVPVGVPGELYVSGACLARGYLNRPELTAEKFIPDPFSETAGERMYGTGDLARYTENGLVEFLGRVDFQVKVRGFRIELGEIESALRKHPALKDVLVVTHSHENGPQRLVAYYVSDRDNPPPVSELRDFLKQRLPSYMVPAIFIAIDELPLLPNGKINRKALPEPKLAVEDQKDFQAPSTREEQILAKIWQDLLHAERVSVTDNFFELGGDSILSLQMVARAGQAGVKIQQRTVFEHPTIRELAASITRSAPVHAEQDRLTGNVRLTPVQMHFFELQLTNRNHYNQSLMLKLKQDLKPEILKKVVSRLIEHHDALRMRFEQRNNDWQAFIVEKEDNKVFHYFDLRAYSASEQSTIIGQKAEEVQRGLDITNGPLIKVAYFDCGAQHNKLFIVIHHLVVDGISWRILTDDLKTAYLQFEREKEIQLPPKSTSFQYWAKRLHQYALESTVISESDFWESMIPASPWTLPVDFEGGQNDEGSVEFFKQSLDKKQTGQILQALSGYPELRLMDVLLGALFYAVWQWTKNPALYVLLEGHGRESIFEEVDLSRTVGWFTTLYPFFIQTGENITENDIPQKIHEQLKQVPQNGIGFDLLRYLNPDPEIKKRLQHFRNPPLVFNYLGQFDSGSDQNAVFKAIDEFTGSERDPHYIREHLLDISASVKDAGLVIQIAFSKNLYAPSTIKKLMNDYLRFLNIFSLNSEAKSTESKIFDVDLQDEDMGDLLSELNEE
ncbi:MAG: amino acid adenylation domain-containing protein [Calditrichaeota bacterium]|nr:amino acid adenylation domain-containing protein [Calditrichota bacterium]